MSYYYSTLLLIATLFFACSEEKKYSPAENSIDCVRKFAEATLKNNIKQAEFYTSKDSISQLLLHQWHKKYCELKKNELDNYAHANIIITKDTVINDSVELITYYNSHKKKPIELKVIKSQGIFLIDLAHTFYGSNF